MFCESSKSGMELNMIVKCVKIINQTNNLEEEISQWISVGEELPVLSISEIAGKVYYRICPSGENFPSVMIADQFVIIDGKLPRHWRVIYQEGKLFIGPEKWSVPGFWERLFDADPNAMSEYNEGRSSSG